MPTKKRQKKVVEAAPPTPVWPVAPVPGTRMLEIPPASAPFKLPEEQVERVRREDAARASKGKGRRSGKRGRDDE